LEVVDAGLAYDKIINREGKEVTSPSDLESQGLNRFCSASLFEANQFGAGKGLADRIFFTGEEGGSNVSNYALDPETHRLYALPWFGRSDFENVAEVDTGTTNKVAFVIGDDSGNSPLLMYVGDKVANGNFLERNGLVNGKLFVWVADDPANATDAIELNATQFSGTNNSLAGKFVEIPHYNASSIGVNGYDNLGFATLDKQTELAAGVQAFNFYRPEDVGTNPKNGTEVAFNATGGDPSNQWGTTYRIDIDFNNIATGDITGKIDILYDGNDADKKDFGIRSQDNLDWADDGKIYIQEDRSTSGFGQTSGEEASIYSIDPSATDPSATLTRVAQVDRTGLPAGQTDSAPTDLGNWETSGILDVSTLFGNQAGKMLVFDVQAHSLKDGAIAANNLVEGGQLSFLIAPNANLVQDSSLVAGSTSGADTIEAKITAGFDGINDIVFSGAGDDTVDVATGGALTGFNRINLGSGKDTVFVSEGDRANGGSGDDYFDATGASKYRLSGGKGNDIFDLGMDGRAIGGEGDDQFYVGEGGDNLLSGGAGADQFWLLTGDVPETANTVVDFTQGTDVIGIMGQGAGFTFNSLTRTGNNIALLNGDVFATLNGFDTTTLTAADFVFI